MANVSFECGILACSNPSADKFTTDDLLKGFFKTYSDSTLFDRRKSVISISSSKIGGPFIDKEQYKKVLRDSITDTTTLQLMLEGISNQWAFMIVDPFDPTYNPGRAIQKGSIHEQKIQEAFSKTLNAMII